MTAEHTCLTNVARKKGPGMPRKLCGQPAHYQLPFGPGPQCRRHALRAYQERRAELERAAIILEHPEWSTAQVFEAQERRSRGPDTAGVTGLPGNPRRR